MQKVILKTNIHCANCLKKISPLLNESPNIKDWSVDLESPDKILTITGTITETQLASLLAKVNFSVESLNRKTKNNFWQDITVWKRASRNTLNCLVGCSIGDFGAIIYLQYTQPNWPLWQVMALAIVAGLLSSILLETVLLQYYEKISLGAAFKMALGMSMLSMLGMELAMNITDFMVTGGQANFSSPAYWLAILLAMLAGFFVPLPYNYYKLKKHNKSCH